MATKKIGRDTSTGRWAEKKADVGADRMYKASSKLTVSLMSPHGGYTWSKKDIKDPRAPKSPEVDPGIAAITPTRAKAIAAHEMSDEMIADIDRTIAEHKGKPTEIKRVKLG